MLRAASLLTALIALALSPVALAQAPGAGFALNAELVENHAIGPSSGGRLLDGHFYITTGRSVHIFDTADAEHPVEVGSVEIPDPDPAAQRAPEEDPDTNGKVLLVTYNDSLHVFDVSDKANPTLLSSLSGVDNHTISCALDCTWAYGSEGAIVDLRDPRNPKLAGNWHEQQSPGSTHDVTEVAPGILLTATAPLLLLDVRGDPTKPEKLAEADPPGFVHATMWPHQMGDRYALVGGESLGPRCDGNKDATFQTWDTTGWQGSKTFKLVDEYGLNSGVPPLTGTNAAATFCTHWFGPNATYRDGGLVGIGWYEHGTRFLKIGLDGQIEEIGYFIPMGTRSSGVYFRTDRIAYVADYYRGFDVVRFTGDIPPSAPAPAAPPTPGGGSPPATRPAAPARPRFSQLVRLPSARRCVTARRLRIGIRRSSDPVVAARVRVGRAKPFTVRGSRLRRPIRVRRVPRGRFSVQIEVRTRSGARTAGARSYRGCRS